MKELVLNARRRESRGKGAARRLRGQGEMPAVMYGEGENLSLVLNRRELRQILSTEAGANALMHLKVEGEEDSERLVMIRDLQSDPVRDNLLHADLLRISMEREVEIEVPIELEGEPIGVRQDDGHLGQILWNLNVRCLPNAIPASIKVDVNDLGVGDVLHVADLKPLPGVAVLTDPEEAVASVTIVTVEEEKVPAVVEEEIPAEAVEGEAEAEEDKPEEAQEAKEESSKG